MNNTKVITFVIILAFSVAAASSYADSPINILHSFSAGPGDAAGPSGNLIQEGPILYGTTSIGGDSNNGTIFSINVNGGDHRVVHSFTGGAGGAGPGGTLVLSGSTLYGVAGGGTPEGGIIYSIGKDGSNYRVLHFFSGMSDGFYPTGSLVLGGSTLYGMTSDGGGMNSGTIFAIDTDGSNYRILHSFSFSDGSHPGGTLILSDSTLYGMTLEGITLGGNIFSINTDGSNFKILHIFPENDRDGYCPWGGLVLSGSTMYGMTSGGGKSYFGVIFAINTDGSYYRILHSFSGGTADGREPWGDLALSGGLLYGMTPFGGSYDNGTIFSISTNGTGFRVNHSFGGGEKDGLNPFGSLIVSGNLLYGVTPNGGGSDLGTIFSFPTGVAHTLTAAVTGSGRVTSSPSRLSCSPVCSASFAKGTKITLTPAPDNGSVFTGWTGACTGTDSCSVMMTSDITVGAAFEPGSCIYTLSSNGKVLTYRGGSVSVGVTAQGHTFCSAPDVVNTTDWITYTAAPLTRNKGPVRLKVPPLDSSITRVSEPDTFTIAGQTFTVTQTGKLCTFSLIPGSSRLLAGAGDTGSFDIRTSPADCTWKAVADGKSTWITIDSGGEGTNKGTLGYNAAVNDSGRARTGKIVVTVGGKSKTYTVRQGK